MYQPGDKVIVLKSARSMGFRGYLGLYTIEKAELLARGEGQRLYLKDTYFICHDCHVRKATWLERVLL